MTNNTDTMETTQQETTTVRSVSKRKLEDKEDTYVVKRRRVLPTLVRDGEDSDSDSDYEPSRSESEETSESVSLETETESEYSEGDEEEMKLQAKKIVNNIFGSFFHNPEVDEPENNLERMNTKYHKLLKKMDLDEDDFQKYYGDMKNIVRKMRHTEPNFFRVLKMDMPEDSKVEIISKLEELENSTNNDTSKLDNWVNTVLNVPFGKYKNLAVNKDSDKKEIYDFLKNVYTKLDKAVYGNTGVKEALLEIVAKKINNPQTKGQCIAIVGPPGCGKTAMIKNGLSKALDLPFANISMAGVSDESHLSGFSYTYEGAKNGRISQALIQSGVMNPIFFMDELDKVSDDQKGQAVVNKLIELTDFTQNSEFEDNYFSGINLDLSKSTFVFTLNNLHHLNPILRDRLEIIHVNGFSHKEKETILKDYLIPEANESYNTDIKLSKEIMTYMIKNFGDKEAGVRKLKESLDVLFRKLLILELAPDNDFLSYKVRSNKLTVEDVGRLLEKLKKPVNPTLLRLYC